MGPCVFNFLFVFSPILISTLDFFFYVSVFSVLNFNINLLNFLLSNISYLIVKSSSLYIYSAVLSYLE